MSEQRGIPRAVFFLAAVLFSVLIIEFVISSVGANVVGCNNQPPTFGIHLGFQPNRQIDVVIFDDAASSNNFTAIDEGIRSWNSVLTCAGLSFKSAVPANRAYVPNEHIPDDTIYVIRPPEGTIGTWNADVSREMNNPGGTSVRAALMRIENQVNWNHSIPNYLKAIATHEAGHLLALENLTTPADFHLSVMGSVRTGPTCCDVGRVLSLYCPAAPSPTPCFTPTPTPTPTPPMCEPPYEDGDFWYCPLGTFYNTYTNMCCLPEAGGTCDLSGLAVQCGSEANDYCDCREFLNPWSNTICQCNAQSPVIIDVLGDGISLTDAVNGVDFDLNSDGAAEHLSWTAAQTDDAWLALDRNGNGVVDNGSELFGNYTDQPVPPFGEERNGFLALAEYDKPENLGNGDGYITRRDAIFDLLLLWQDLNHNGVSEPSELFSLPQLGLRKLHLDYRDSRRVDEHGNRFKYKAKVKDTQDAQMGRWAWDVFLVKANP